MPNLRNKIQSFAAVLATSLSVSLFIPAEVATAVSGASNSLHGVIASDPMWHQYKSRFVTGEGRVIDNANGNITHSEGQGFAMLMAVAANDRATFERLWQFTKQNLAVRRDHLFAWKWRPALLNKVPDKNNATDGDILIAWALLEAAQSGFGKQYDVQARKILHDVRGMIKADKVFGQFILPAKFGFDAPHHKGYDIINLSYWVFPALERIADITKDRSWRNLAKSGERLLRKASANRSGLPADWNTLKRNKGKIGTSYKFNSSFSYNAVRLPLYLAWSRAGSYERLESFQKNWVQRPGKLAHVNVKNGRNSDVFNDAGYKAIAALVNCSVSATAFPKSLRRNLDKLYYPASLQMLSVIATKQRYPQCW